jgi:hypothetical protein
MNKWQAKKAVMRIMMHHFPQLVDATKILLGNKRKLGGSTRTVKRRRVERETLLGVLTREQAPPVGIPVAESSADLFIRADLTFKQFREVRGEQGRQGGHRGQGGVAMLQATLGSRVPADTVERLADGTGYRVKSLENEVKERIALLGLQKYSLEEIEVTFGGDTFQVDSGTLKGVHLFSFSFVVTRAGNDWREMSPHALDKRGPLALLKVTKESYLELQKLSLLWTQIHELPVKKKYNGDMMFLCSFIGKASPSCGQPCYYDTHHSHQRHREHQEWKMTVSKEQAIQFSESMKNDYLHSSLVPLHPSQEVVTDLGLHCLLRVVDVLVELMKRGTEISDGESLLEAVIDNIPIAHLVQFQRLKQSLEQEYERKKTSLTEKLNRMPAGATDDQKEENGAYKVWKMKYFDDKERRKIILALMKFLEKRCEDEFNIQLDNIKEQSRAWKLMQTLKTNGVRKWNGGYTGSMCRKVLELPFPDFPEVERLFRTYKELDKIFNRTEVSDVERTAKEVENLSVTFYAEFLRAFPHWRPTPYMHQLMHARELLERHKSIGRYSAQGIELMNQRIKRDSRRHLGNSGDPLLILFRGSLQRSRLPIR